jgi:hypothetical protein
MLKTVNGIPVEMSAEEEAEAIAGMPTPEQILQSTKDTKIAEIDKATQDTILAIASVTRQRNLLAEGMMLLKVGGDTSELEAIWVQIKDLRDKGNAAEVAIQAMTTVEDVQGVVV